MGEWFGGVDLYTPSAPVINHAVGRNARVRVLLDGGAIDTKGAAGPRLVDVGAAEVSIRAEALRRVVRASEVGVGRFVRNTRALERLALSESVCAGIRARGWVGLSA